MKDLYYTKQFCISGLKMIQAMTRLDAEKNFLEERIKTLEGMRDPSCRKGFYQNTIDIITDPFKWDKYK